MHLYISCPYTCTYTHPHNTKKHTHTSTYTLARKPSPYDKAYILNIHYIYMHVYILCSYTCTYNHPHNIHTRARARALAHDHLVTKHEFYIIVFCYYCPNMFQIVSLFFQGFPSDMCSNQIISCTVTRSTGITESLLCLTTVSSLFSYSCFIRGTCTCNEQHVMHVCGFKRSMLSTVMCGE
jgi:hypothetical protein